MLVGLSTGEFGVQPHQASFPAKPDAGDVKEIAVGCFLCRSSSCPQPSPLKSLERLQRGRQNDSKESGLGASHLATAISVLFAGSIWMGNCSPKVKLRDTCVAGILGDGHLPRSVEQDTNEGS